MHGGILHRLCVRCVQQLRLRRLLLRVVQGAAQLRVPGLQWAESEPSSSVAASVASVLRLWLFLARKAAARRVDPALPSGRVCLRGEGPGQAISGAERRRPVHLDFLAPFAGLSIMVDYPVDKKGEKENYAPPTDQLAKKRDEHCSFVGVGLPLKSTKDRDERMATKAPTNPPPSLYRRKRVL